MSSLERLTLSLSLGLAWSAARDAADVLLVGLDQLADLPSFVRRMWTNVGHRATEADVVPHKLDAVRIRQQIIDVGLANTESSVDIAPIMRFVPFGHLFCSLERTENKCGKAQAPRPVSCHAQHEIH